MKYAIVAVIFLAGLFAGINVGISICARYCVMFTGPMVDLVYTDESGDAK